MGVEDSILQSYGLRSQMYRDKGANHERNAQRIAGAVAALGESLGKAVDKYKSNKQKKEEEDDVKAVSDFEMAYGQVSDDPQAFMEDLGKLPTKTSAGAQLKLTAALRRQAQAEKSKAAKLEYDTDVVAKQMKEFDLKAAQTKVVDEGRKKTFFQSMGKKRPDPNPEQQEPGYFGEMGADPLTSDLENASLTDIFKRMAASGVFSSEDLEKYGQLARMEQNDRLDADNELSKQAEAKRHNMEMEEYKNRALTAEERLSAAKMAMARSDRFLKIMQDARDAGLDAKKFDYRVKRDTQLSAEEAKRNALQVRKLDEVTGRMVREEAKTEADKILKDEVLRIRMVLAGYEGEDKGYFDEDIQMEMEDKLNKAIDKRNKAVQAIPSAPAPTSAPTKVTPGMSFQDWVGPK